MYAFSQTYLFFYLFRRILTDDSSDNYEPLAGPNTYSTALRGTGRGQAGGRVALHERQPSAGGRSLAGG